MTHLEEQLKRIHLSPAQETFFRQVGTIDENQYFDTTDTTAAIRQVAVQLAKDVLAGVPLYQVYISTENTEKQYRIRQRALKLDLGGFVYTNNWAISTLDFAVLFGVAMKTVIVNNETVLDITPEGAIQFNHALLAAQCSYVESAFAQVLTAEPELSQFMPMVFAYIKAVLLIKQKVVIPQIGGDFDEVRRKLARYIPKRTTWDNYLQYLSAELPFDGAKEPITMLASLTDITVDSLPYVEFCYRALNGQIINLRTFEVVTEPAIIDSIFTSAYDTVLLTPELLKINTPEREKQLYDLFQFYHKG